MLLTSGGTLCCEQLTQHSTAWKVWKSQINLMQSGCTSPTAPGGRYSRNSHCLHYTMHSHNGFVPSSWALLSVMKNWGDHPGFHSFSFCKPSCINSSVSYWGIIVATTRPIPSSVFTTRKKQGNPYRSVFMLHPCMWWCSHIAAAICFAALFEGLRERIGLHLVW